MIGFDKTVKSMEKFANMSKDYVDALEQTLTEIKDHKDDQEAVINDMKTISTIGANLSVIGRSINGGANEYIKLLNEEEDA